jgi:hypothetical protein
MQCSDCSTDLDDALILVCDHNLCLQCAARKSAGTGGIRCQICSSLTSLEPASSQQLREMFPQFSQPAQHARSPVARPVGGYSRPPLSHIPLNVPSPALSARSLPIRLPSPVIPSSVPPVATQSGTCGQCERTAADLRCLQCEEVLCFDCSETLHRKGRMANHQTVPIHLPAIPSTPMSNSPMSRSSFADRSVITMRSVSCATHPDEIVQYFCLKCETKPMCSECVFRSGDHTNHLQEVVLIKKAFPKVKSRINDLVIEFEKSIKDIKINEINLSENKKSMENLNHNCKGQVSRLFSELREVLRVKELELTSKIEEVVDRELKMVDRESQRNSDKRSKIESVSRLLNSVTDVNGIALSGNALEKEIELLDSFSEMKTVITESRSELIRNDLSLVQLFIPNDQVATMTKQIEFIKESIRDMRGIVPSRNAPTIHSFVTPQITPAVLSSLSTGSTSGRKKHSSRRSGTSTPSDVFLMNAIDEAMKAS